MKTAKTMISAMLSIGMTLALGAAEWEIERDLGENAFWESDPMLLMSERGKLGFSFTSGEKTAADCRRADAVSCFGFESYETVIRFGEEKGIDSVEMSLYNIGGVEQLEEKDFGDGHKVRHLKRSERDISREEFMKIVKVVSERLTPKGAKAPKATDGAMRTAETAFKEMVWKKSLSGGEARLSWSYSQKGKNTATFKPGFIKLKVSRPLEGKAAKPTKTKVAAGSKKITDNICKDSRGTFLDNVPMVDQGAKGYCAAATSERVLKYYGVDVDEHEIAQMAGTDADKGTSTKSMKDAVERIGRKFRLATVICYGDFDEGAAKRIDGICEEVAKYNKAAKKLKCKPITDDVYIRHEGNMTYYDSAAVDQAMEPKVLVDMKTKLPGFKKFKKDVVDQINKGIPLFWGVKLGVAAEPEIPQTMGYHMRLIIGYNDKKGEVIYTDSWGAGHELKKMRYDWAWTITKSLFYLKPLTR